MMNFVPTVIESNGRGERAYDIFSRLLEENIIFIGGEINDAAANIIVAQLLYLDSRSDDKDICLYINSPGGSVSAGMAIYDTMRHIKRDVSTICVGMAASMGAFILAGGKKGKRFALPNSEIMIHQPLGNAGGQTTDIRIAAEHMLSVKQRITDILAQNTGKTPDEISADCERDSWKTPTQAVEYGLIDKVISAR